VPAAPVSITTTLAPDVDLVPGSSDVSSSGSAVVEVDKSGSDRLHRGGSIAGIIALVGLSILGLVFCYRCV